MEITKHRFQQLLAMIKFIGIYNCSSFYAGLRIDYTITIGEYFCTLVNIENKRFTYSETNITKGAAYERHYGS